MFWLHGWLPLGWTIQQIKCQQFLLLWCNSWFWGQAIEWMVLLQLERNKNCLRDIPFKDQYKVNQGLATKMLLELMYVLYANISQQILTMSLQRLSLMSLLQYNYISFRNNLFMTSKNETTNSPIYQFLNLKCCKMSLKWKGKA